jgi:hypothetical protein
MARVTALRLPLPINFVSKKAIRLRGGSCSRSCQKNDALALYGGASKKTAISGEDIAMDSEFKGKPARLRECEPDGPIPTGRTRQLTRAEQEREQGPARDCVPKSARSDQLRGPMPRRPPQEMSSQKGAMELANRLQKYWHERGFDAARFWAEPIAERFDKIGSYEIYRVASNLVNGVPPRYRDR